MPEGTDNKVRAEIQFDREFSSSTDNCIMVARPTPSHHCDGYNSSGGNDSDDGSSYWDRNPRSGHSRGPVKKSTDMHGAQEGINTRTRNLGLYRQESSQTGKQAQSLQYQVSSKRKPKKRSKSCKENDFEKEYWKEMKGEFRPETLKFECEEIENEKSIKNWKKRKPIEQSNNVEVLKDQHRKKIKENKELSENGEEELEKFDRERDTFLDKDQNYMKTEYSEDNFGDCEMKKFRKDSFNEKMFAIENDQTAMLKKQNLKKIDALNPEKIDQEKEITNEQNILEKEKMKVQQGLEIKKRWKAELEDRPRLKELASKEELVVNMEQGRDGLKNADKLGLTLDNKALDSIREKLRDKEETGLKQFLDPQCDTQTEKQDVGKEISPLGQELYMADKESSLVDEPSSLGFEVEESLDETVDPESSVKFPNLEIANKLWEQSRREYNICTSIDENSCSFSWERPTSIDSLVCTSLAEKEQWEVRQSCPHLYGSVCYQDSNRLSYEFTNILMHKTYGQAQKEALSELNKKKIYETINTKSDKKDEFEDYEEKFKKEERDRKDENLKVDENKKLVNAVEKTADDDDTANDADDKVNVCKGDEHVDDDHHADLIDSTQKNEKESANNNGNGNADFVGDLDDEIDEESLEIIDAEEKDLDEKENTTAEDRLSANSQDKFEDNQIDANAANTVDNADIQEKSEGAPDTPERLMGADESKKDEMAHCRLMFEDTKENKKRNQSSMVWKGGRMKKFCDEKPDICEKMKRIPKPALPNQADKLAPKKNWNGRRYSMFGPSEFGRKCSTNSGGRSGNGGRNNNSGGNPSPQRNNGDKNSKNRRNQDNKDRDDDDKNNINNNNPGHPNTKGTEPENVDPPESTRDLGDVSVPSPDFKGYRKKHTNLDNFGWLETVGQANEENGGPVWDLFLRLTNGEHMCFSERLDHLEDLSHDALQCSVCLTVDSLLKHYAHCLSVYNTCSMCVKIFSLICSHVADCLNNNSVSICEIRICKAVRVVVSGSSIGSQMKTLWFQVRKKLARISDDAEEDVVEPRSTPDDGKKRRPYRVSGSSSGPLPSIPEGTPLTLTSTSRSGSRVLRHKKSNLTNVEEKRQSGVSEEEGSSSSLAINAAAGAQGVEDEEQNTEEVDSKHGLYSRPEIPDEADAIPTSSEEGSVESTGSGNSDGSGQFGMMAGVSRFVSLPMGPPGHGEPYFPSFKDRPTGKKGIGEVVYAGKHQLVVVVTVWEKFKTQYLIEAKLARHYTEEGVILADFKSKLHIKGLRYQNEFQWVKIAHLGNGMTGKCHLAMDFETEFKFCVKEIHISNYEKEEIELWSELDHPNIVQVYGAIRHGEEIYILQEFIEGGCLTEAINIQRKLGRRLSQLAALRYFQQLVQVLKYLKTRNILHEDLKADNILLNKTSEGVSLKVADFGLARRCQGLVRVGTKPVGTQTQWSPEKAEAVGYGFAAEIWAAVCVLVHMLSGLPPWVRRYESFKALIVVIVEKSPPLEDIPRNIHEPIKDLIRRGFTVCQGSRPTAEELLLHSAFRLLEEAPTLQSTSGTYSILESMHFESPTNRIDYDPNADLREIYRNLERESAAGATASNSNEGARRKDRKVSSIVDVHGEELPYYSNDYRVYTVGNGGRESKKAETPLPPAAQAADEGSGHQSKTENAVSVNIYIRSRKPSQPDDNIDPMTHIDRFYNDNSPTIPPQTQPKLVMYHPNLESIGSQKGNSSSREPSLENLSSGTVTEKLIPDFEKILQENIGDDVPDIVDYRSDEEGKEDNILENFDFEEGVRHVRENYNLPTVVNTSTDLSSGTPLTSEQGIPSHAISAEKNSDGQIIENLAQDNANKINSETVTKEAKSGLPTGYPVIGEDQLPSINDDDLFKSGSPPKFSPEMLLHSHSQGQFSTIQEIPEAFGPSLVQRNEMLLGGSGMVHQMITPGRQRLEGSSLPPLIQHVPTSKRIPGHPRTAPTDTYMRQHRPDQQQDLLYLGQQGQQQMLTQNQQQYYLQQTQQRQDLSHTPNFVTGLGTAPRHYPSGQNTSVPSYQYHQHGQGQLNVHGGNSVYANNFQGQRQMMHVQNQFPLRSEIQPEDLATSEHFNQHRYTNPYGLASMPNQYGKTQFSPVDPLSMYTQHFNPRQTSTPRSDGHHNGARPKVPQQPKQLFTGTEGHSFGRRPAPPASVNLKINDPRRVYGSVTGRVGQYPMYPVQPKTPILNPVINPRPVTPQEGQRVDLWLDIGRAQQAPDTSALSHAQTAPVFSPPKTPKKSPDLHRTMSQVPVVRKSPSLVGVMSASSSTKDDRMSSSASKSQFEEQDDAYRELGRTAEEALSQHSDPASRIFFTEFDDDIDEEIKGEMHGLESYLENPAESLAHLLDPEQDCSITVTFRSSANAEEFSMKFSPKHTSKSWEKIIKEELDGFSRVSISDLGLQRFCLRRLDGSVIDLESCLGNKSCTAMMVEATDNDPWWIEGGIIYQ